MTRLARDNEITAWQEQGWVLLDGLIGTDEIDHAAEDLTEMFPTREAYHADPEGSIERWVGRWPARPDEFVWPADGPGFRPEQQRFRAEFPFPGKGRLNRLCVHPSIVDFAERALANTDLLIYQLGAAAKYTGDTNYEQPMHTDRNHSWLPSVPESPWWHLQTFLYLSDMDEGCAPTHLVPLSRTRDRTTTVWGVMPREDPALYAAELSARGVRGSLLAYRTDVFHRGVNLTEPGGARFYLGIAFKLAAQRWIGFNSPQSQSTSPAWVRFAERATPRELELFGFPPPGHPIWTAALLDETALLYPKLDLTPWRVNLKDK